MGLPFGALFTLVTYDAGALSEHNAKRVVESGKHFAFRLKGEQRTMFKLAEELLDPADFAAESVDVLDNQTVVRRRLTLLRCNQNWAYGDGKSPEESIWKEAQTFLRVDFTREQSGEVTEREVRFHVTSLEEDALTPEEWLRVLRGHWGVETVHQTLDVAFAEDDRPWSVADGPGNAERAGAAAGGVHAHAVPERDLTGRDSTVDAVGRAVAAGVGRGGGGHGRAPGGAEAEEARRRRGLKSRGQAVQTASSESGGSRARRRSCALVRRPEAAPGSRVARSRRRGLRKHRADRCWIRTADPDQRCQTPLLRCVAPRSEL